MALESSALLTDLYQLTMLQGYLHQHMHKVAVFEFFVRQLPATRGFLVSAGLGDVIDFLQGVRFSKDELKWIAKTKRFDKTLVRYLEDFRFTGDVHAMPEGTVFFADEPILRITAPLPQAQLVESRVINLLHYQTMVASKAARSVLVAPGKFLVDFSMRRAHGAEAALLAAKASYLAGFSGTSNVLAGKIFGIPVYGTVAHSFIEAHDDEKKAFFNFALSQPDNVMLLLDTYDTDSAARKVISVAKKMRKYAIAIKGVRLDSGNLERHAKTVRRILDSGGLREARIFVSGNLDEETIRHLIARSSPIDGFGVGTRMATSCDAPYLDCAYKLQEYALIPRRKRSEGKPTWPGRKQVYRFYGADGCMSRDVVSLHDDSQKGEPLLVRVMRKGSLIGKRETLDECRKNAAAQLAQLPKQLKRLDTKPAYAVEISRKLRELAYKVDMKVAKALG